MDVVERLHDPTDQAPKLRHLRVLAHVQLDDDPRTPIQQSVGEEFRQHDGVVTIFINLSFPLAGSRRRRLLPNRMCVERGGAVRSALSHR